MVRFFKKSLSAAILLTLSCIFSLTSCNSLLDELDAVAAEVEHDKWIDDNSAVYTVMHYQQRILDDDYDWVSSDTEYLSGLIGEKTEASAKNYDGFTAQSFEQQEILEDGSTVVSIYYDRNSYTLTFWSGLDEASLSEISNISSRYGSQVSLSVTPPAITNYTFMGWSSTFGGDAEYQTDDFFTIPASDTNLYAVWDGSEGGIDITISEQVGDIALSSSVTDSVIIFTTSSSVSYSSYTWVVDGTLLSSTDYVLTLDMTSYASGVHSITVYAESSDGSIIASTSATFSVTASSSSTTVGSVTMLTGSEINALLISAFSADSTSFAFTPYTSTPSPAILSDSGTVLLSESSSEVPCYAWKDGTTIYYYAEGYTDSANRIPLASDCSSMFSSLRFSSIDLSLFSSTNVTTMESMFERCAQLESIDISGFDSASLTTTENMFYCCYLLPSVSFPAAFTCSKVVTTVQMFDDCRKLSTLDLSHFDSSALTEAKFMFAALFSLSSITLGPAFTCENVTNTNAMFAQCEALTQLDLEYFNPTSLTKTDDMFNGCKNLSTLYTAPDVDWSSATSSSSMFYNCTSLTGGNGTAFDSSKINAAYARVDGLNGNAGYFTAKE